MSLHRRRNAMLMLLLVACSAWLFLPGRQGTISQPGYRVTMALLSACNRKDAAAIDAIDQLVNALAVSGQLQGAQAKWIDKIILQAKQQDWEAAASAARKLLRDQVTVDQSLPELD